MNALLYRLEAHIIGVVPIGLVPEGIRLDAHFEGTVVDGELSGATVSGTDHLLIRSDGITVLDVRETLSRGQEHVAVTVGGYVVPPAGMAPPPPEMVLAPDFVWPDLPLPMVGYAIFRTGAPSLAVLNRTVAFFDGTINLRTGRMDVVARAHEGVTSAA